MARSGMDYTFFQILSENIEKAQGPEKEKLTILREKLLEMTKAIDEAVNEQLKKAHQLLVEIVNSPDIEKAISSNIDSIDEFFLEQVRGELQAARDSGDLSRISKIQKLADILQKMSAPPPEIALIESLVAASDENSRQNILKENSEKITPEFMDIFSNLLTQSQNQAPETAQKIQEVYNSALRFSMMINMKK
jgi:hypothetical protein